MKSDREFIDGIYEKAARYREESEKEKAVSFDKGKRAGRNRRIRAAAAAAVFLIGIGVTVARLPDINNQGTQEQEESSSRAEVIRMLPEEEQGLPAIAGYSVDSGDTGGEAAVSVLTGEVSGISGSGDRMQAMITGAEWIIQAPEESPSEMRLLYPAEDSLGRSIVLAEGDKVLLYVSMDQGEEDACSLENGFESVYFFWKEEDGGSYYKNCDGTIIDSRQLTEE